jgi:hypothetical protein
MRRIVRGRVVNGVVLPDAPEELAEGMTVTIVADEPRDPVRPDLWGEIAETTRLVRELRTHVGVVEDDAVQDDAVATDWDVLLALLVRLITR